MKEIIVYQSPSLKAKIRRFLAKKWLSTGGNFLLIFAFLGIVFTYGPVLKTELGYRFKKNIQGNESSQILEKEVEEEIKDVPDPNFSLVIPKINASAKIVANVDSANSKEYLAVLKHSVAHAKGTVFPGMRGTIYLFAHSTDAPYNIVRYNAIFYLLRELEIGDEIIVFFAKKKFNYYVADKKIVQPTETSFFDQKEEEILVLQTCWPPGTTQKALLVFAKRREN